MPSPPTPKKWKAAVTFTYRHIAYAKGDPVTDRRTINQFAGTPRLAVDRTKPATADQPEPEQET